jgi:hypothetical protein
MKINGTIASFIVQGKSDLLILLNRDDCMNRFDCKYLAMVWKLT